MVVAVVTFFYRDVSQLVDGKTTRPMSGYPNML